MLAGFFARGRGEQVRCAAVRAFFLRAFLPAAELHLLAVRLHAHFFARMCIGRPLAHTCTTAAAAAHACPRLSAGSPRAVRSDRSGGAERSASRPWLRAALPHLSEKWRKARTHAPFNQ